MLSTKIENALHDQIHHEFENAYIYLAISAWFHEKNLPGFGHWMQIQHEEELEHAMKLFGFIFDRGGKVRLQKIESPRSEYASVKEALTAALKLEELTTQKVNSLYALSGKEEDFATQSFLKWYVDEQVEEEKNVNDILAKIEMAGESKGSLLYLDHELGKRAKD